MKSRIATGFSPLDPTGHVAIECWSDYKVKLEAWRAQRADFEDALRDWPAIQAQLRSFVKWPEVAARILHVIGSAPAHFEGLTPAPTDAEVQFAFGSAPLIRHRFTLGDLFVLLNWDQETLWAQVNKSP